MNPHIVVLSGSNRRDSQSVKVARYLRQRLVDLHLCESSELIDLATSQLPLWPEHDVDETWRAQQSALAQATALIVVSPEWNGMACPALKNFFLYAGLAELGHKPALLVGVSAGTGGAYPIAELRASSYKNCRIAYLPEQLIIRHVESVLNGEEPADPSDSRLRARADWTLRMLCRYEHAFHQIRAAIEHPPAYISGM